MRTEQDVIIERPIEQVYEVVICMGRMSALKDLLENDIDLDAQRLAEPTP